MPNGGILGPANTPTYSSSKGIWRLEEEYAAIKVSAWARPPVQSGLIAYLDAGNSGSYSGSGTSWVDLSGTGNTATLYNSPSYSTTNSGYLNFNGSNQYAQFPSGMADFTTGITVCGLINFGGASGWERIIDFGSGSAVYNILFAREGTTNNLSAQFHNNGANIFNHTASGVVQNNAWAFYTWTFDGTNSTLGVNGTYYTYSSTVAIPNVTRTNNYIVKSNWADSLFENAMQTILVYNRALTQAETTANFNIFRSRFNL